MLSHSFDEMGTEYGIWGGIRHDVKYGRREQTLYRRSSSSMEIASICSLFIPVRRGGVVTCLVEDLQRAKRHYEQDG